MLIVQNYVALMKFFLKYFFASRKPQIFIKNGKKKNQKNGQSRCDYTGGDSIIKVLSDKL
jgi:hypothetical protein